MADSKSTDGRQMGEKPQGTDERLSVDALVERAVERAVLHESLPPGPARRDLLRAVGSGALLSALSAFFPLGAAKALAQEKTGALELKELQLGFVPITCATPIIMADPMGFYAKQGLKVTVVKTAGWALIRDKVLNREYHASHMLSPMPLAISLGAGSRPQATYVAAIENINGQAITLHLKHKERRDPRQWKGMKFAVPFDYSMHNLLLRYYVAEHGIDPDKDIEIRVVPPPEMVANLRAGNIDGYLGPEPFNQRAVYEEVGFIHLLSKELWDGHPCCALGVPATFIQENPNTFAALFRAIATATAHAHKPENRVEIAKAIAPANYLNQPLPVVEQVLTGRFADGLGKIQNVPDRADFDPFPWHSMAVWILTQLKRWGYLKQELDYRTVAEQVFLATDARRRMIELGLPAPKETYKRHVVMGKTFDPAKPDEYVKGFAIRRS
jgi:nitrate/nitrite transport system substrate-binding protein